MDKISNSPLNRKGFILKVGNYRKSFSILIRSISLIFASYQFKTTPTLLCSHFLQIIHSRKNSNSTRLEGRCHYVIQQESDIWRRGSEHPRTWSPVKELKRRKLRRAQSALGTTSLSMHSSDIFLSYISQMHFTLIS